MYFSKLWFPLISFWSIAAWSQSSDDLQRRAQEQERRAQEVFDQLQRALSEPDVRLQRSTPSASLRLLTEEATCFEIREVTLESENSSNWIWLLKHADGHASLGKSDPVEGRCLGAQGVQTVITRLQDVLIAKGYVTSRVLAPPQDLQSGRLKLQLLPGRIQEIRWTDGSGQRGSHLNTLPVKVGDVLNLRDIEQALENYKRVPTVDAQIDIQPGRDPGFSDLVVRHEQLRLLRLNAGIDDSGTRRTGKLQGHISLSLDNGLTLSDMLYVTLQTELGAKDAGPRGIFSHTLHYSVPWGYNLLSATFSQNRFHQTVAGANADVLYSGTSAQNEIRLSRIVQRDNAGKSTLILKGFQRTANNFIDDQEVEVQRRVVGGLEWGIGHRRAIDRITLDGSITYRLGTGAFGSMPAPEESFGEGTSRMRLWLLNANMQWPFQAAKQSFNWNSTLRAQYNTTPLTPQDRFSIGSRFTVRGFDGLSVLTAERGWLFRNDLSLSVADGTQLYAGIDHGQVSGPSAQNLVGQSLTGLVIGWRGQYKRFQYDVFAGKPLQKPDLFNTASVTAGFSLNISY